MEQLQFLDAKADDDLLKTGGEFDPLSWLDMISTNLDRINVNFKLSQKKTFKQSETKFKREMCTLISKANQQDTFENAQLISNLKKEHTERVQSFATAFREGKRVRKATCFAKSNPFSFAAFRSRSERRIAPIKRPESSTLISDPFELVEHFAEMHSIKTNGEDPDPLLREAGLPPLPQNASVLQHTLSNLGTSLEEIMPLQLQNLEVPINNIIDFPEIKAVFKTMKQGAAPGPSGRDKCFYHFLFKLFPDKFVLAANDLANLPDIDSSPYAWYKRRKIIFIRKKNKKPVAVSDYRPISLLEVFYKIVSKALSSKLTPYLADIVGTSQFGFVKTRCMNTAQTTLLLAAEEIRKTNQPGGMLFLDIAGAFDSIISSTNAEILSHTFPDSDVPSMLCNLTQYGMAYTEVNGYSSQPFKLRGGTGQGDPFSTFAYNVQHTLWTNLNGWLISRRIPESIMYIPDGAITQAGDRIRSIKVDPVLFADDSADFLNFSNITQARSYLNILALSRIPTGLRINHKKSNVVLLNKNIMTDQSIEAFGMVGSITDAADHLGSKVGAVFSESAAQAESIASSKLTEASQLLSRLAGNADLFHRHQLLSAVVGGSIAHIFRTHTFLPDKLKELDKTYMKAMWRRKMLHQDVFYGRVKIATARITSKKEFGGLSLVPMSHKNFLSFMSGFFASIKFALANKDSFLAKILTIDPRRFFSRGSRGSDYIKHLMVKLYPQAEEAGFTSRFTKFLAALEEHPKYFMYMPIAFNCISGGNIWNITSEQIVSPAKLEQILVDCRIKWPDVDVMPDHLLAMFPWRDHSIGSYLVLPERRTRHSPSIRIPPTFSENSLEQIQPDVKQKLLHIQRKIRKICPLLEYCKQPPKNIFFIALTDPGRLSKMYKDIYLHKKDIPPSLATRARDNVERPTTTSRFLDAYASLNKTKWLDSASRSHAADVLNRTISTPLKLWRIGTLDTPFCPRCDVIADSQHLTLECDGPFMANKMLLEFFRFNYSTVNVKEEDIIFMIPIKNWSPRLNSQFIHLSTALSKLLFFLPADPRFPVWTPLVFFAKIFSTVSTLISLRRGCKWPYDMIKAFQTFLASRVDRMDEYSFTFNRGHFRANPRDFNSL